MTFGTPFHRGHMTPNHAIQKNFGRHAQLETFFMTNMSPQLGALNSGLWASLEAAIANDFVADNARNSSGDVWVIAGPIYGLDPNHIVRNGTDTEIDIPAGFFTVLVDQTHFSGTVRAIGFESPNQAASLAGLTLPGAVVSIDDIEAETALDFFPNFTIARQNNLEGAPAPGVFAEWFGP